MTDYKQKYEGMKEAILETCKLMDYEVNPDAYDVGIAAQLILAIEQHKKRTLEWAACWVEYSAEASGEERTKEFARNMAMSIRADGTGSKI